MLVYFDFVGFVVDFFVGYGNFILGLILMGFLLAYFRPWLATCLDPAGSGL